MKSIPDILPNVISDHFNIENALQEVAVFSNYDEHELRLIEVNNDALPTGQVEPFVFAARDTSPIKIYIADVTPNEWSAICDGKISLPQGWPSQPKQIFKRNEV